MRLNKSLVALGAVFLLGAHATDREDLRPDAYGGAPALKSSPSAPSNQSSPTGNVIPSQSAAEVQPTGSSSPNPEYKEKTWGHKHKHCPIWCWFLDREDKEAIHCPPCCWENKPTDHPTQCPGKETVTETVYVTKPVTIPITVIITTTVISTDEETVPGPTQTVPGPGTTVTDFETTTVSTTFTTVIVTTVPVYKTTTVSNTITSVVTSFITTTLTETISTTIVSSIPVTIPGPTVTATGPTITAPGPTITATDWKTTTKLIPTTVTTTIVTSYPVPVTETISKTITSVTTSLITTTITTAYTTTLTEISTVPGPTVSLPGKTETQTEVITTTLPGSTVSTVITLPPSTTTVTTTLPGKTVTESGSTVTLPGSTTVITTTLPATTEWRTTTLPGSVTTITRTRTVPETVTRTVSDLTLCPSRTVNPTYTPRKALPTDYTWGCPPGTLCKPKKKSTKSGACNFEVGLPSPGFFCSPDECKAIPPRLPPQHWGQPVVGNEVGRYVVSPGYFNLNPKLFNLDYDVFAFQSAPSRRSVVKRQSSTAPAVCLDDCNNCALEVEGVGGKNPIICKPDSAFKTCLANCKACIDRHPDDGGSYEDAVLPNFEQFLRWCEDIGEGGTGEPQLPPSTTPPGETGTTSIGGNVSTTYFPPEPTQTTSGSASLTETPTEGPTETATESSQESATPTSEETPEQTSTQTPPATTESPTESTGSPTETTSSSEAPNSETLGSSSSEATVEPSADPIGGTSTGGWIPSGAASSAPSGRLPPTPTSGGGSPDPSSTGPAQYTGSASMLAPSNRRSIASTFAALVAMMAFI